MPSNMKAGMHNQTNSCVQTSPFFWTVDAIVLSAAVPDVAQAGETDPTAASPPSCTALRYDEDYNYLKNPAARTDAFDPIKYISLSDRNESYLTLGGQLRDRYEYFNNYLFGSGYQDRNGYNLLRTMLNADLHLGPHVRVFAEGISATERGRVGWPRSSDVNEIERDKAFVDVTFPLAANTSLNLRGGRQVIVFGVEACSG